MDYRACLKVCLWGGGGGGAEEHIRCLQLYIYLKWNSGGIVVLAWGEAPDGIDFHVSEDLSSHCCDIYKANLNRIIYLPIGFALSSVCRTIKMSHSVQ